MAEPEIGDVRECPDCADRHLQAFSERFGWIHIGSFLGNRENVGKAFRLVPVAALDRSQEAK